MKAAEQRRYSPRGTVILIGGAEDKGRDGAILSEIARLSAKDPIVICTAGSSFPEETAERYRSAFRALGVKSVPHLRVRTRQDAEGARAVELIAAAKVFFFTGGDQLRIASIVGGTPLHRAIEELHRSGGVIAGTSAGASALGETMPYSVVEEEHRVAAALSLAPGLRLLNDVVIDQHFAQRGRLGRLVAAVTENPRLLGIGIDENTAVVWKKASFTVMGTGAVYVVDGHELTRSNLGTAPAGAAMSAFDIRLHVLNANDSFDVAAGRPQQRC